MKYLIGIITFIFLTILSGCLNNKIKYEEPEGPTMSLIKSNENKSSKEKTGTITSGLNISGKNYFISVSGNKVLYSGLFSINMPKYLDIRRYYDIEKRLDFITDSSQKYMHIDSYDIPNWKIDKLDKEKCILGNYESHILSSSTTSKVVNGQTVYITKAVRSAGENKWNDLDLCFIEDNVIYRISVSAYETDYAQDIINSFKFIK